MKILLCTMAIVATVASASAQTAQSDDDRRAQGAYGAAKLAQDNDQSNVEIREALDERIIESEESENRVATVRLRDRGMRAAFMRDDRFHSPQ
jgi:hypothetical protein